MQQIGEKGFLVRAGKNNIYTKESFIHFLVSGNISLSYDECVAAKGL
jgi:hypothetical protein